MDLRSPPLNAAVGNGTRVYTTDSAPGRVSDGRTRCHFCHLPIAADNPVYGCPVDYDDGAGTPGNARFRVRGKFGSLSCLRGFIVAQPAHERGILSMNLSIMATLYLGYSCEQLAAVQPGLPVVHYEDYGGPVPRASNRCSVEADRMEGGPHRIPLVVPEGTIVWKQDRVVDVSNGVPRGPADGGMGTSSAAPGIADLTSIVEQGAFAAFERRHQSSDLDCADAAPAPYGAVGPDPGPAPLAGAEGRGSGAKAKLETAAVAAQKPTSAGKGRSREKKKRPQPRGPLDMLADSR